MQLSDVPFGITDWSQVDPTEHGGEAGVARARTRQFGAVRVRLVECAAGELETELADGRSFRLTRGMSYQVADNAEPHRSRTAGGATLFIVD